MATKRTRRWLVTALALLIAWALVWPIRYGGLTSWVTTFGISMEPKFTAGDLIAVHRASDYQVGDIAAYHSQQLKLVTLHRIVAIKDGRATFKGDNNDWLDPETPPVDQLVGKYWFAIPAGGTWLKRLMSPPFLGGYSFLLVLLWLSNSAVTTRHRRGRREMGTDTRHGPSSEASWVDTLTPTVRWLLYGSIAAAAAGALLAALAFARPTVVATTTNSSGAGGQAVFSYSAKVPQSPAYQGTLVESPSPVFRSQADEVTVDYAYAGKPGKLTVTAELATDNGWRWSLPLANDAQIGSDHSGQVKLQLSKIYKLATQGATAIGVPISTVAVSVVPRVHTADGDFAPALEMQLDTTALRLITQASDSDTAADDQPKVVGKTITVTDSAETSVLSTSANTLDLLLLKLPVGVARWLGLLLLLLGAAGLFAVARLARRTAPESAAEAIARQYQDLIVPVTALPRTTDRIVDVADIHTLAKLANRYSLLILHLPGNGVDTYLVQDESTAYRLRLNSTSAVLDRLERQVPTP